MKWKGKLVSNIVLFAKSNWCFLWLVLAIELLAACQGIEFLRPLRTTTPLEKVYELVRSVVK